MSGVFGGIETSNHQTLRLHEVIDMVTFPDKQWVELRFMNTPPMQVRQFWIKILGGKDKREIEIPRYSVNFDPANPKVPKKGVRCPYSELSSGKDGAARQSDFWLLQAIDRDKQEEGPGRRAAKPTKEELKTGKKDIRSDSWTPVRVVRMTYTMINRMKELGEDNIVRTKDGSKKQFDAADPKYGFDVKIKFKKDAAGSDKYSIDKVDGGRKPLTEEEKKYLLWDLTEELLDMTGRKTTEEALEDIKRMEIVGDVPSGDDDDEDEAPSPKKRSRLDDDDDEDDEDDEDEAPRRVKKSSKSKAVVKSKSKKPPFDDDEDEGEDDEDDEDDEPKRPVKKSSKTKAVAVKKKTSKKTSIDDDEDEDDEDDEPKRPVKKSSKTKAVAVKKKKSSIDDDDDDDDEPAPVRKKKPVAKSSTKTAVKKKKRPAFEDD